MKRLQFTNGDVKDDEPHRLAGALPRTQPEDAPTDEHGDGVVLEDE